MKRVLIVALLMCLLPAVAKADRGGRYSHGGGGSHSSFSISLGFGGGSYGGGYSHVGFGYSSGYPRYGYGGYRGSYCAPAPVYCPAPVTYYAPPVVYQPTYCPPPVVYVPAPRAYYYDAAPCYTPRTSYYDTSVRFSYRR